MTVTTEHAASTFGQPVILDDSGRTLDYGPGVKAVRSRLGLSVAALAGACGVSDRTVEGWEQGRHKVPAAALNVMGSLLRRGATSA